MKCPNCGKVIVDNSLFCNHCGFEIRKELEEVNSNKEKQGNNSFQDKKKILFNLKSNKITLVAVVCCIFITGVLIHSFILGGRNKYEKMIEPQIIDLDKTLKTYYSDYEYKAIYYQKNKSKDYSNFLFIVKDNNVYNHYIYYRYNIESTEYDINSDYTKNIVSTISLYYSSDEFGEKDVSGNGFDWLVYKYNTDELLQKVGLK